MEDKLNLQSLHIPHINPHQIFSLLPLFNQAIELAFVTSSFASIICSLPSDSFPFPNLFLFSPLLYPYLFSSPFSFVSRVDSHTLETRFNFFPGWHCLWYVRVRQRSRSSLDLLATCITKSTWAILRLYAATSEVRRIEGMVELA